MSINARILLVLLFPLAADGQTLVKESSGLALGSDGLVWTHSDGPNIGEKVQDRNLYAFGPDGSLARLARLNVRNDDWEDLSSFVEKGKRYLLVADVGDNRERRDRSHLYVVEEPRGEVAEKVRRISFRYPDRPHDCEAAAVDVENGRVLLVTKRDAVPQIYAVPLHGTESVQTAVHVGSLWPLPKSPLMTVVFHPLLGNYTHQPTGMDISSDNRKAVIITYRNAYLWRRQAGEAWEEVLAREPDEVIALPAVGQREGVAFSADGTAIHISEEGRDGIQTIPIARY